MSLYRVLIVDDEEEIRAGMVRKMDWTALGFEIVGEAENGADALEVAESTQPDVIMTDIRMPFMDGLEFLEKVTQFLPTVKVIVFSGFEDFEYAQRAIRLGVEEYILKPVSASQLEESLHKLREKMDGELEKRRDVATLRRAYQDSLPLLRQQFMARVIEGWLDEAEISIKLEQYHVHLTQKYRAVILFGTDNIALELEKENVFAGKEELIPISIKQSADTIISSKHDVYTFIYGVFLVAIIAFDRKQELSNIYQEVNEVCRESKTTIGIDVTAGIGGIYTYYKELNYSYQEAQEAWEHATMFKQENEYTVYFQDIAAVTTVKHKQMEDIDERLLLQWIKNNDATKIREYFEMIFEKLKQIRLPFYEYQTYVLEILSIILRVANTFKIDPSAIWGVEKNYLTTVFKQHSLEIMCEWFIQSCKKIGAKIQEVNRDPGQTLVEKAKTYVEEHYSDSNLSVEAMCDELHVSPAYFSTLFKRETKMNFITYVTDIRVERAMKLLDTTSDKTYMIAEKVGYTESNYFSYVFKKKVGVTPSKYRNREV